jgi:hypothetical protein
MRYKLIEFVGIKYMKKSSSRECWKSLKDGEQVIIPTTCSLYIFGVIKLRFTEVEHEKLNA